MSKLLTLLFLSFTLFAQQQSVLEEGDAVIENPSYKYVPLADNKVYDVEIIVFAYRNALPNDKTFHNKAVFDDSKALSLDVKPDDYPEIDYVMFEVPATNTSESNKTNDKLNGKTNGTNTTDNEYTIPLEEADDDKQVLVWFEHTPEEFKLTPIWNRLVKKVNIVPLIHKAWRQPETPFEDPTYVKLNNSLPNELLEIEKITPNDVFIEVLDRPSLEVIGNTAVLSAMTIDAQGNFITDEEDTELHENRYADFTLTGMVALSQGRFMHFGNKLNLFRTYNSDDNTLKNMIFSLIERKQMNTDELNYFDSPWFGSIVKITEYTGEQEDDIKNKNSEE